MVLRFLLFTFCSLFIIGCSLLLGRLEGSSDAGSVDENDSDQVVDSGKDSSPDGSPDADKDDEDSPDAEATDADDSECPMNSGAFCRCDRPWEEECDDGSFCLTVENLGAPGEFGLCAPLCDCSDYNETCSVSHLSLESRCILTDSWPLTPYTICNCVLIHCDINAQCPYGQTCQTVTGFHGEYEGVQVKICSP